jgi:hypothetical protein
MLHLPTGLELVVLRSRPLQSVITVFDMCVSKRKPPVSRGETQLQMFQHLWANQHTTSVTQVTHYRDTGTCLSNAPLAWSVVPRFLEGESAMVPL